MNLPWTVATQHRNHVAKAPTVQQEQDFQKGIANGNVDISVFTPQDPGEAGVAVLETMALEECSAWGAQNAGRYTAIVAKRDLQQTLPKRQCIEILAQYCYQEDMDARLGAQCCQYLAHMHWDAYLFGMEWCARKELSAQANPSVHVHGLTIMIAIK